MSLTDDIALIRSVGFLSSLGDEEARLIAFGAERRRMGDGERLMREGSYSDGAYVVVAGEIVASTKTGETQERLGAGTIVSPLALVSEIEHPQTAVAQGAAEVLKISRPLFRRVMQEYPHVAVALHDRISRQLASLSPELERILADLEAE